MSGAYHGPIVALVMARGSAMQRILLNKFSNRLLMTDYWIYSRGFDILSDPCHYQKYDRSMLYPSQLGSEGCWDLISNSGS